MAMPAATRQLVTWEGFRSRAPSHLQDGVAGRFLLNPPLGC